MLWLTATARWQGAVPAICRLTFAVTIWYNMVFQAYSNVRQENAQISKVCSTCQHLHCFSSTPQCFSFASTPTIVLRCLLHTQFSSRSASSCTLARSNALSRSWRLSLSVSRSSISLSAIAIYSSNASFRASLWTCCNSAVQLLIARCL